MSDFKFEEETLRYLRACVPGPMRERSPPEVLDAYVLTLGPPLLITDRSTGIIHKTADVLARAGIYLNGR